MLKMKKYLTKDRKKGRNVAVRLPAAAAGFVIKPLWS